MYCQNCGIQLKDGTKFCPSCGTQQNVVDYNFPVSTVTKAPYNVMSIVGFVVSCISLLINFWGIVGIAGTVLSVMGLLGCQQKNENGKALAIIGIVLGGFSVVYGAITLVQLSYY